MSSVTVAMYLSDAARREYTIRTGRVMPMRAELGVELADFTAEERARLVAVFGLPRPSAVADLMAVYPRNEFAAPVVPESREEWLIVLTAAEQFLAELAARRAAQEAREAAKQAAAITAAEVEIARVEGMSDEELVQYYEMHSSYLVNLPQGRPAGLAERREALLARVQELIRTRREAKEAAERAEAAARETARLAWVEEHGSAFLRKAVAAGYDCQRRYVLERAALEHPGAVVDIENAATWRSRSCPSERALDLALSLGGEVVWLTAPPQVSKPDPDEDEAESFEAGEAVVVRGYLGKYDVVYTSI